MGIFDSLLGIFGIGGGSSSRSSGTGLSGNTGSAVNSTGSSLGTSGSGNVATTTGGSDFSGNTSGAAVGAIVGGIGGLVTQTAANKEGRKTERNVVAAIERARVSSGEDTEALLRSPEYKAMRDFILGQYTGEGALAGETSFINQLRNRQSERGLFFSAAGAKAEALGASAYRFQRQAALLPQLLALTTFKNDFATQILRDRASLNVFQDTGGRVALGTPTGFQPSSALGAAFSGALAGLTAGAAAQSYFSFGGGQNNQLSQITSQTSGGGYRPSSLPNQQQFGGAAQNFGTGSGTFGAGV